MALDSLSREDLVKFVKKQTVLLQRSRARCEELQKAVDNQTSNGDSVPQTTVEKYEKLIEESKSQHDADVKNLTEQKDLEISRLESRVCELDRSLSEAEGSERRCRELEEEVECLRMKGETMVSSLQCLQQECKDLNERLEALSSANTQMSNDKSKMEAHFQQISMDLEEKEGVVKLLNERLVSQEGLLMDKGEQMSEMSNKLREFENIAQKRNSECDNLSVVIKDLEMRIVELDAEKSTARSKCAELATVNAELNVKIQETLSETICDKCSNLEQVVDELKKQLASHGDSNQSTANDNESLLSEIEALQSKVLITECSKDEACRELEILRDDVARLNEYIANMDVGNREQSDKSSTIGVDTGDPPVKLSDSETQNDDPVSLHEKKILSSLKKECDLLMSQKSMLEYELNEVKEERDMLVHEGQSDKEQLKEWEVIIDLLRNDKQTVIWDLQESELRLVEYQKEVKDVIKILQEGLDEGEREMYSDDVFYQEQYEDLVALRTVSTEVVTRTQKLIEQARDYSMKTGESLIDIDKLKSDLETLKQEKDSLETEMGSLSVIVNVAQDKEHQVRQAYESLSEEHHQAMLTVDDLKEQLSTLSDADTSAGNSELDASKSSVVELTDQVKHESEQRLAAEAMLHERCQYVQELENKVAELADKLALSKKLYESSQIEIESRDNFISSSMSADDVGELKSAIETLENEKSAIANDLREKEDSVMNLEQTFDALQSERDELSVKVNESLEKIDTLEQSVSSTENDLNQVSTENTSLKHQLDLLLNELSLAKDEVTELRKMVADRGDILASNECLTETKKNFEDQLECVMAEQVALSSENEQLKMKLAACSEEIHHLKTTNDNNDQEINRLELSLGEVKINQEQNENEIKRLENALEIKYSEKSQFEDEIVRLEKVISELKSEIGVKDNEIVTFKTLYEESSLEKENHEKEICSLRDIVNMKDKYVEQLVSSLETSEKHGQLSDEYEVKFTELATANDLLKTEHSVVVEKLNIVTEEYKTYVEQQKEAKDMLNSKIQALNSSVEELNDEKQRLLAEAENSESLSTKIGNLESMNKELCQEAKEWKKREIDLNQILEDNRCYTNELKDMNENLNDSVEKLEKRCEVLESNNGDLIIKCDNFVARLTDIYGKMCNVVGYHGVVNTDESRLVEYCEERLNQIRTLVEELKKGSDEGRVKYIELQERYDGLQERYSELQGSNDELQRQYNELQGKYNELQGKYDELQGKYDELQGKYDELQGKYDELQGKYDELQGKYNELQGKYNELQGKYDELQRQYDELQRQYDELQGKYDELQGKYDELQGKYDELQGKYDKSQSRYNELQKKYDELQRKSEFQGSYDELQLKYNELQRKCDELQAEQKDGDEKSKAAQQDKVKDEISIKLKSMIVKCKREIADLNAKLVAKDKELVTASDTLTEQQSLMSQTEQRHKDELAKLQSELEQERSLAKELRGSIDELSLKVHGTQEDLERSVGEVVRLKQLLVTRDEELSEVRKRLDDTTGHMTELTGELESRTKQLEEAKQGVKQSSMMDLEMADYERSIKKINEELLCRDGWISDRDAEITRLNERVGQLVQQTEATEKQCALAEDRGNKLKQLLVKTKKDLSDARKLESEQKSSDAQLRGQMEHLVQQIEESKVQLSQLSNENLELRDKLGVTGEAHQRSVKALDQKSRHLQESLDAARTQLTSLQAEYDAYKVRAHSVLKKQKTRQQHESLLEVEKSERERLEGVVDQLRMKLKDATDNIASFKQENDILKEENEQMLGIQEKFTRDAQDKETSYKRRIDQMAKEHHLSTNQLTETIQRVTNQNESLVANFEKETRTLQDDHTRVINLLNKQMKSLESENARLLRDLSAGGVVAPVPVRAGFLHAPAEMGSSDSVVDLVTDIRHVERQSGEGMENVESHLPSHQSPPPNPTVVPLDQLLSISLDDTMSVRSVTSHDDDRQKLLTNDVDKLRETVTESQKQIAHLTELLHDSETTVVRLTEQARLLKEEIRRLERNQLRDEEMRNLEYLKNILLKFVSLKPGDERSHLLPVLTTMLKLSDSEKVILASVAQGDDSTTQAASGWGSYIHRWSSVL